MYHHMTCSTCHKCNLIHFQFEHSLELSIYITDYCALHTPALFVSSHASVSVPCWEETATSVSYYAINGSSACFCRFHLLCGYIVWSLTARGFPCNSYDFLRYSLSPTADRICEHCYEIKINSYTLFTRSQFYSNGYVA